MKITLLPRALRLFLAGLALALATATPGFALESGIFELDGNAITNHTDGALPDDWDRINPGPGSHAAVSTFLVDPPSTTIFTGGGSKDVQDISSWQYTSGSVPDKDELTDAFAAAYVGSTGDLNLYFGADRFDNSGDSQLGFWFFQNQITLNPLSGSSGTFNGVHKVGDILILSDFTTGGTVSTIRVFEWVGSGGSNGPLNLLASGVDCNSAPVADALCAIVNSVATKAPWAYQPKMGTFGTFPVGTFFEGGADLSKILSNLECFASFLAETRSSQSVTATLKDFVVGRFNFTPSVSVGNRTICQGDSTTLTATVSGGIGTPTFSWTGPNGFTATTQTITVSVAGTYTVTVSTSLNCKASASATLTVNPKPSATITPPSAQICAGSSQTFTVTPTGGTAPYTITWTGPNGFTASGPTITVSVTGIYTATVKDAKGCSTSVAASLIVNANPQVSITGPTGCQSVPAILTATVTGGSGALTFSWTGPNGFTASTQTISISTGGTYKVLVTDANGCHGQATRVVGLCLQ
jgi:roadblock/LC7 domain-containing protein